MCSNVIESEEDAVTRIKHVLCVRLYNIKLGHSINTKEKGNRCKSGGKFIQIWLFNTIAKSLFDETKKSPSKEKADTECWKKKGRKR